MKKLKILLLSLMFLAFGVSSASAIPQLYDFMLNIDGSVINLGDPLPPSVDTTGFDAGSGLGSIAITVDGVSDHFVGGFFNHDINPIYYNDFGSVNGTPTTNGEAQSNQSWEIDGAWYGDIYSNIGGGSLDNINSFANPYDLSDFSWAMGWDFTLETDKFADITFLFSDEEPTSGFYLTQTDYYTGENLYFSSTFVDPPTGGTAIPDFSTVFLLGSASLIGFAGFRRKFRKE